MEQAEVTARALGQIVEGCVVFVVHHNWKDGHGISLFATRLGAEKHAAMLVMEDNISSVTDSGDEESEQAINDACAKEDYGLVLGLYDDWRASHDYERGDEIAIEEETIGG